MTCRVIEGDCLTVLPALAAEGVRVQSVVCDPPYHLTTGKKGGSGDLSVDLASPYGRSRVTTGFMNQAWDGGDVAFQADTWRAVAACMAPGAHLLAFGGTRTYHRMAVAIEDAGFEIRDTVAWLYGSGFPKSLNVAKAIDAVPGSAEAAAWIGWGTALKPAFEPIILARLPLIGTVAGNVLAHGCGALNIDASRVEFSGAADEQESKGKNRHADFGSGPRDNKVFGADGRDRGAHGNYDPPGRWPANVAHDGSDEVEAAFAAFGERTGTASRFFYCAKATAADRAGSAHPTVKPTALMRWLVQMVTPPGGTVLDPFAGTGSTGLAADQLGLNAILIEREAQYVADIKRKISADSSLFAGFAP